MSQNKLNVEERKQEATQLMWRESLHAFSMGRRDPNSDARQIPEDVTNHISTFLEKEEESLRLNLKYPAITMMFFEEMKADRTIN